MNADWLRYANQNATRSRPLDPRLVNAFGFLPDMGLSMEVFSGGQPSAAEGGPRTGSVRHDHGGAGDVFFYQNGRRLDWANPQDTPIFQDIVRRAKANGVTGFGAGPGYMQPGSMHVGFGNPGVWGAEGSGKNAPSWLVQAYGGAPAGSAPTMADAQAKTFDPVGEVMAAKGGGQPSLAAAFAPGGPAPVAVGIPATPQQTLGSLALMFAQQQQAKQQRQADEQQAEQIRRSALFGQDSLAGLFGTA